MGIEMVITSDRQPTLADWQRALSSALPVADVYEVAGAGHHVVDGSGRAVVTWWEAAMVEDAQQAQLVGGPGARPGRFWTSVLVPEGDANAPGPFIAHRVAQACGGELVERG